MAAALRSGRAEALAVARGAQRLESVLALAARCGLGAEEISRQDLVDRAGEEAQGCAVLVSPLVPVEISRVLDKPAAQDAGDGRPAGRLILACDHVQDPRNLGAIARTLDAVAGAALIFPDRRSVSVTPAVERTAAGAFETLPWAAVPNLVQTLGRCRAAGYWIFGAVPDGDPLSAGVDWAPRSVLVVGAEGRGISALVRRSCDRLVALPMRGSVESLNAAVAAGILLYDWVRWDTSRRASPH